MSTEDKVDSEGRYWRIAKWFPELSPELVAGLKAFHSELIFFNGRMNLISPRTEKTADLIHIADAILGSRAVLKATSKQNIFDVGSGNGIPGLVLAMLDPARKVSLLDSDARKIEFMKHCIGRLGIKNCTAVHARIEDLGESAITCGVSRGWASVSKALLALRKVAAPGCEFFHFKGPSWSSEVAAIPSQILASWEPSHLCDYPLPTGEAVMTIVLTKRI